MIRFGARPVSSAAIVAGLVSQTVMTGNLTVATTGWVAWGSRSAIRAPSVGEFAFRDAGETISASLVVEANNVLAQRGGISAQTVRIYNTFTDASNHERAVLGWSSNIFEVGTTSAGTGSNRTLRLNGAGTIIDLTPSDAKVYRDGTSAGTIFGVYSTGLTSTALLHTRLAPSINQASGTYTILDINPTETAIGAGPHYYIRGRRGAGADDFNVQRNGDMFCGAITIGANVMTMTERADPGVAGTNQGRLYLRDNGGGKTQLVVVFQSGSPIILATEV